MRKTARPLEVMALSSVFTLGSALRLKALKAYIAAGTDVPPAEVALRSQPNDERSTGFAGASPRIPLPCKERT
ncbi:hypothetical protein WH297_15370 [Ochrobactrum vermis]|uniref:Uncharacterized protein n=1 Tax=Ochrobactrum vermis TaxID=1827297 RepID=A0ABU8PI34_9HYPH|nr:hypothetical protein [Ochrobactrum vermis]